MGNILQTQPPTKAQKFIEKEVNHKHIQSYDMETWDHESTTSQSPTRDRQLPFMQPSTASLSTPCIKRHSSHIRVPIFQIKYPSSGTCTLNTPSDLHTFHNLHLNQPNPKIVSPTNEDEIFPLLEQHSATTKPDARSFPHCGKAPPLVPSRMSDALSCYQLQQTPTEKAKEDDNDADPSVHDSSVRSPSESDRYKVEHTLDWFNNIELQLFFLLCFLLAIITTIAYANESNRISLGILCGSLLTLFSCVTVLITFLSIPTWRKHPNPILVYRSLCDICLAITLVTAELYECASPGCNRIMSVPMCLTTAGVTQFFLWASESWFLVMAIDMVYSFESPFTDYRRNMRRYHVFVWCTACFTSVTLLLIANYSEASTYSFCWVKQSGKDRKISGMKELWITNSTSWIVFNVWLLLYWIYAVVVLYIAWKRYQSGFSETLGMRIRVLQSVTISLIAIVVYWGITFITFIPYLSQKHPQKWILELINYMITCKGYFDVVVWLQMNKFVSCPLKDKQSKVKVDIDLSPQVNMALRREVLYFTTTGIIQAVHDTKHLPSVANQQEIYLQPPCGHARESLGVDEFLVQTHSKSGLDKGTLFTDYCPHTFARIRQHFQVSDEQYVSSLSRTTKERLSEGASGAFMFFSHDQQLIVKSMSNEESNFLRSIALKYATYLTTHPETLLVRFYGCHAIRLYGNTFHFVVMANLFNTAQAVHQRYDLKGSYVKRSAKHPTLGERVTCRLCNAKYIYPAIKMEACASGVGKHEPNIIFKDNDFRNAVRLDAHVARDLYRQLVVDADFLHQLGIMDYSLLMGIHNVEYTVKANETRASSSLQSGENSPPSVPGMRRATKVVGPALYYFGLIDILQTWTNAKKVERLIKVRVLRRDGDGISAVPPEAYCERFKRKMAEILNVTLNEDREMERID